MRELLAKTLAKSSDRLSSEYLCCFISYYDCKN